MGRRDAHTTDDSKLPNYINTSTTSTRYEYAPVDIDYCHIPYLALLHELSSWSTYAEMDDMDKLRELILCSAWPGLSQRILETVRCCKMYVSCVINSNMPRPMS